jgi:Transglutaminase-like superfamily
MRRFLIILVLIWTVALKAADSVDLHLLNISKSLKSAKTVKEIKSHFSSYGLKTKDLVTVYSYWIINHIDYDVKSFLGGTVEDVPTTTLLSEKKAVCYGYSKLLNELCNSSGIHSYLVKGTGKGLNYKQGEVPNESNHSWNVVKIDTQYFLFDLTWAAGYVDYNGNKLEFVRMIDPTQIFADPATFINKHLPNVPWFQLQNKTTAATTFFGLKSLPGHSDLSAVSETVDFKKKLDELDVMDYPTRTALVIDVGEKYFSRPQESTMEMNYLAYQIMMRSEKYDDLKQAEQMILKAQGYLRKTKNYKSNALWPNMEQNLTYCRYKLEKVK